VAPRRPKNRSYKPKVTHFNPGFSNDNPCLVGWVRD
jgi:hypothetical protein